MTVFQGSSSALSISTAERPRVLLVCEWFVKYTAALARGMADLGCTVELLTRTHDLEFGGEAGSAEPGAMERWVATTLAGRAVHRQLPGRVRELGAVPRLLELRGATRRFRADYVHVQDSIVHDLRLGAAARLWPGRYAVTVHDVDPHPGDPLRTTRIHRSRTVLIRNAGLVFVHSERARARVIERERPRGAVEIVPHGVGRPALAPLCVEPTVLFFGRVSYYKGVDTLLDAMKVVWNTNPRATVTIAGHGDLPDHDVLRDPRVTVRNEHVPEDEVASLFAAARCVVLPYREASQSGVGAQAKQYGRPLVVTDVGGLPDLVADGGGHLVAPEEPMSMGAAILDVLDGDGVAERMADVGGATALEFGWDRVAELTLAAYERHLG